MRLPGVDWREPYYQKAARVRDRQVGQTGYDAIACQRLKRGSAGIRHGDPGGKDFLLGEQSVAACQVASLHPLLHFVKESLKMLQVILLFFQSDLCGCSFPYAIAHHASERQARGAKMGGDLLGAACGQRFASALLARQEE